LKRIETTILDILPLRGVPNVKKVVIENKNKDHNKIMVNEEGQYIKNLKDEWILETEGTNLAGVLNNEAVDATKTISNHIYEVWEVLGIEAVRQALQKELSLVLKAYGIYVNYRHLAILCDVMTQRGQLMSITRNGINRIDDHGPIRRASFEESVEMLFNSAMFGEKDLMKGISENVILGQLSPIGTGFFDLIMR